MSRIEINNTQGFKHTDSGPTTPVSDHSPHTESLREEIVITPGFLIEDNHSPEARAYQADWKRRLYLGEIALLLDCPDARVIRSNPESTAEISIIATAGEIAYYLPLVTDPRIRSVYVTGHADITNQWRTGEMPEGCGGLHAKSEQEKKKEKEAEGEHDIQGWIRREIAHPDPLVQSCISADNLVRLTGKDTMAIVQNHITGNPHVVAILSMRPDDPHNNYVVPAGFILYGKYDPARIYSIDKFPQFGPEAWEKNPNFRKYMQDNQAQLEAIRKGHPDFTETQKVQNPLMIAMTTDIRPFQKVRFNKLSDPNRIFRVNIGRRKIVDDPDSGTARLEITKAAMHEAIAQVQYAIMNSIKGNGNPGAPFSDTHTVYIETGDYGFSIDIAQMIIDKKLMQTWLNINPQNQLILGESRDGEILKTEKVA